MNKRQKKVLQAQLNSEEEVIAQLKSTYEQALDDCEAKIQELSMRADLEPENIQSIIYQKQYQEAIKAQLEGALANLQSNSYATVSDYLTRSYQEGYLGAMYDMQGQGIPLVMPIDQEDVTRAVMLDSKLSTSLYNRMGEDVKILKKAVQQEVSRGIAQGMTWSNIASNLARNMKHTPFQKAYSNSIRIARTEGHRIQNKAALDAQKRAKDRGAEVVKQWDSTLDGKTRSEHRELDGQIREVGEMFEVAGYKVEAPGMFGDPSQDCNCRCSLNQMAKWLLDCGIDKMDNFTKETVSFESPEEYEEWKKAYWSDENIAYMNYVTDMEKKYGKNFETVLNSMTDKEYERYKRLLDDNLMFRKKPISEGLFDTINNTKADSIRPRNIIKDMCKSDIGRQSFEYIQKNQVPIKLLYGIDNPDGLYGYYDPMEDAVAIFCDKTKTTKKTAEIVIHEATHRKLGGKGTLAEEIKCFEAEAIHRNGELTQQDKEDIIKLVRKLYPELT